MPYQTADSHPSAVPHGPLTGRDVALAPPATSACAASRSLPSSKRRSSPGTIGSSRAIPSCPADRGADRKSSQCDRPSRPPRRHPPPRCARCLRSDRVCDRPSFTRLQLATFCFLFAFGRLTALPAPTPSLVKLSPPAVRKGGPPQRSAQRGSCHPPPLPPPPQ